MRRFCLPGGTVLCIAAAVITSVPASVRADDRTATLKLERKDQLLGAIYNHTVYINGEKVGKIGNGAKKEFSFTPKIDGKNAIYIEAYDPIVENPKSNTVSIAVFDGGVLSGTVQFEQNGTSLDLVLKVEVANNGKTPAKLVSVDVDSKLKRVVLKQSPAVRLAKGSEKVVEDSVTVVHSVTVASGWKTETEVRGRVTVGWAEIGAGIKREVEQTTGSTYAVKTERKRKVKLVGDGSTPLAVAWVEYYRTGTATWQIDGKEVKIPFQIKEDFDLEEVNGD